MNKAINPYTTRLDAGNAYWMARLSAEVYEKVRDDDETPDEEKILQSLQADDGDFKSVTGANRNSAQAALIEHQEYLCMVFRGTNEPVDWLDNMNIFRKDVLFGEFHRGFWRSVKDVWDVIYPRYQELRKTKKRPLFLTGHSLGGAMATIAAARFIHQDMPFTAVYTFGQPRVMNRVGARIYNMEAGRRHHRFQNNEDIVTRAPARLAGYSHVGQCFYIDSDGKIHDDTGWWFRFLDTIEGAVENLLKLQRVGLIKDHDVQKYLKIVKEWDVDF